jgi:hypothetical protein
VQVLSIANSLRHLFDGADSSERRAHDFTTCHVNSQCLWTCILTAAPQLADTLQELHIEGTLMVNTLGMQLCVDAVSVMTQLRCLDMRNSWLAAQSAALLEPALLQLTLLERLYLGTEKQIGAIGEAWVDKLMPSIIQLSKLQDFEATAHALSLYAFMQLLSNGSRLQSLRRIDVRANLLNELDPQAVVSALPSFAVLTELDVSSSCIADSTCTRLRDGWDAASAGHVVDHKGLLMWEPAVV